MARELWIRLDLSELLVDHRLAELSDEALGAALRICAKTVRTGGAVPKGSKILTRNQRVADELLSEGFIYEDESGDFRSHWLDEKLAETQAFIDKQRAAGKASAAQRRSTTVQPPLNQRSTTVEPPVEVYTSSITDRPTDRRVSPTDRPTDVPTDRPTDLPAPRGRSAGTGASRETWLTPFLAMWERRTGGAYSKPARAAGALSGVVKKHGGEAVALALARYLEETPADKCSFERFAETYGAWSGLAPPSKSLGQKIDDERRAQMARVLAKLEEQDRTVEVLRGSR